MLFKSKTALYITDVIEKTESIKKYQSFLSETLFFLLFVTFNNITGQIFLENFIENPEEEFLCQY